MYFDTPDQNLKTAYFKETSYMENEISRNAFSSGQSLNSLFAWVVFPETTTAKFIY